MFRLCEKTKSPTSSLISTKFKNILLRKNETQNKKVDNKEVFKENEQTENKS